MFHMNKSLRVVLAVEPVDLRKSFNGLHAMNSGRFPKTGRCSFSPTGLERESRCFVLMVPAAGCR